MNTTSRTVLTVGTLFMIPLVIFRLLLGNGRSPEFDKIIGITISPVGFLPLILATVAFSILHHGDFSLAEKRRWGWLTLAAVLAVRGALAAMFWGDSYGTLAVFIFGVVELMTLAIIGILFQLMRIVPISAKDAVRVCLFSILLAVSILQSFGVMRPGWIE